LLNLSRNRLPSAPGLSLSIQSFLRQGFDRRVSDDVANGAYDIPGETGRSGDILSERFNAFGLRLHV
jgi:hypothetical protein